MLRVEVRAGGQAQAPGERGPEVGEDVAEEVRRHDDIQRLRVGDHPGGQRVDVITLQRDLRVARRHSGHHLVPQHHRMAERVRLGGAGQEPARPARGGLEAEADDPLDPPAGEEGRLGGQLVIRARVQPAAGPRVLALGVLPHAQHVEVGRPAAGERAAHAGQEPHRPEVDVLLEALADGQDQLPHRHVVGHPGPAHRAEVDGVEVAQAIEAVRLHHPAGAAVVLAAPGQLLRLQPDPGRARGRFEDGQSGGDHLAADPVPRDDRDAMAVVRAHIPGGVKRPSTAVQPPSTNRTAPVM